MSFDCPICLEPIVNDRLITSCRHIYHESCISQWWKKLKRNQCPYCQHCDINNSGLLQSLDNLIVKITFRDIHDISIENLRKEVPNMYNKWYYQRAVNFILSNDETLESTINHCLESLLSRGYLEKRDNLYYYTS